MAVREFDGTDDKLTFSPGGLSSHLNPPITIAAVWKPLDTPNWGGLFQPNHASGHVATMNAFSDGFVWIDTDDGGNSPTRPYADGIWHIHVVGKAAGSVAAAGSSYPFNTLTWTHGSFNTLSDGVTTGVTSMQIGTLFSNFLNARIAVVAWWPVLLTTTQRETLSSGVGAWMTLSPGGLWVLNQAAVTTDVADLTGNGANQIDRVGTTVVTGDDPPNFPLGVDLVIAEALHAHAADSPALTARGPGSWEQLLSIRQEAAEWRRAELATPPAACPNDGEPLKSGPGGVLYCPYDGWRWAG